MDDVTHLGLFFVVVFGVVALPGLDMGFVLARSLTGGNSAGFTAVAGIVAGGIVHVIMGALGMAAILTLWPALFNGVLLAGAAYIAWIGWSLLRSKTALALPSEPGSLRSGSLFVQGMLTCLLNPKAYVFMLAIFPQFLRPGHGPLWMQASALGLITALTQAGVYGAVALLALRTRAWFQTNPGANLLAARAVGAVLIGAALLTATQGWRTN